MQPGVRISRKTAGPNVEWRWLAPMALLLIGMWLVPLAHTCRLSCVPGDLGDARFNGVILEHFYRWLTGRDDSLISPPFFFPMPGVVTFSDNHLGTGWIYATLRWMGADRYLAFDLWYLIAYAANFLASHWVMRRLGFSPIASAVGAFAFSFAMPVIARHRHAQLAYRFLVPIALLCWQRFRESARLHWLGWLALAMAGQFYLSIYLGYFLLLLLAAWATAQCVVERAWPWWWVRPGMRLGTASGKRDLVFALCMIAVAVTAVAWLMYPYLHYSRLYGLQRAPDEIASLLPRLRSYLLADGSLIWGGMSAALVKTMPMRHEQQLFFGAGMLGLALAGLWVGTSRMRWMALLSIALLFALTVSVAGHSLYALVAALPGVNSIRAIARIGLVLAMPIALLVAMGVDGLRSRGPLGGMMVGTLALLMIGESAAMRTSHYDVGQQRASLAALEQQLPDPLPADAMVYVALDSQRPFYEAELDGMILGQLVDRPTPNGYSGNLPPGYGPDTTAGPCTQVRQRLRSAATFFSERLGAPLPAGIAGPVIVPGHAPCRGLGEGPLPVADLHLVSMKMLGLEQQGERYRVRVSLENMSGHVLESAPAAQPGRLSWQELPAGSAIDSSAWLSRVDIGNGTDLEPGGRREIEFYVPVPEHGNTDIAVSFVIEGRAWGHDHGLVPLRVALPEGE